MKNATKLICGEVWGNNIYVVCECGQEIVEFAEDAGEFFLQYHGWYNNKRDKLVDFTFYDKSDFVKFLNQMDRYVEGEFIDLPETYYDKIKTERKVYGTLLVGYDPWGFYICKYPNKRIRHCTWEIVLQRDQVKELVEELRGWL